MNILNKLGREYKSEKSIWWYTYETYLYSILNHALRTLETNAILKLGFFIRDLHTHIEQLHTEQFHNRLFPSFDVYRGQALSNEDFQRLIKTVGGLISFNSFLSTSLDKHVAFTFTDSNRTNLDSIGIFFVININPSVSSVPFANINHVGNFSDENEILFSMHTVFRIDRIEKLDDINRFWQVELQLTSADDHHLRILTNRIRRETQGGNIWLRLDILLMKIGHFNKAEEVYKALLLNQTSDEFEKAAIYNQLGLIKGHQGEYDKAILFGEKSVEIAEKILSRNDPDLATTYGNVALVYNSIGQFEKAIFLFEKSLAIRQKILSANDPSLVVSYVNLGMMYYRKGEYQNALSFYEKAQEIYKKTLPSNHLEFALSYNNIASAYQSLANYPSALLFHQKALEIREKYLPSNHPNLATPYNNIGTVYFKINEYQTALPFFEHALNILKQSVPANHPNLQSVQETVIFLRQRL